MCYVHIMMHTYKCLNISDVLLFVYLVSAFAVLKNGYRGIGTICKAVTDYSGKSARMVTVAWNLRPVQRIKDENSKIYTLR